MVPRVALQIIMLPLKAKATSLLILGSLENVWKSKERKYDRRQFTGAKWLCLLLIRTRICLFGQI